MSNPDRYEYDNDKYIYDQDSDTIIARDDSDEAYDGDGNPVSRSSDWFVVLIPMADSRETI